MKSGQITKILTKNVILLIICMISLGLAFSSESVRNEGNSPLHKQMMPEQIPLKSSIVSESYNSVHSPSVLFDRLQQLHNGTTNPPPSWNKEKNLPSEKYQSILNYQKMCAKFNLLYITLKPFLALCLILFCILTRRDFLASGILSVITLLILKDVWDDEIWMNAFGLSRYVAKPGFIKSSAGHMEKILNESKLNLFSYSSPSTLLSGDWRTIFPSLGSPSSGLNYQRFYIPTFDGEYIGLDFSFPSNFSTEMPLVFFTAGIGGGPDAKYVVETAKMFISKGWSVCVLLPKGMLDTEVQDFKNVFDPAELRDLHHALHILSSEFSAIYLMGFSLGGNTLFNYLARYGSNIPNSCKGSLAISSSIKHSYVNWKRYQNVYQPLFIPDLVGDFLSKYEKEMEELLSPSGVESLCRSRTFQDLHNNMMVQLRGQDFDSWIASTEAAEFVSNVAIPMLVLSALDDPLHNPDLIGTEYLKSSDNGNVAVWLTAQGGHVAWPEFSNESNTGGAYSFISKVADQYFEAIKNELGNNET